MKYSLLGIALSLFLNCANTPHVTPGLDSDECYDLNEVKTGISRPSEEVSGNVAFVHVNVIDVSAGQILSDKTVLVKNSIIESIEPGSFKVPGTYFIIEAPGTFLMPGLADMHTHVWYPEDLLPYVANGVTTILNMGSPSTILQLRAQAINKEIVAPTIFAGAFVDGPGSRGWYARTPAEAEEAVDEIKTAGWDFIKAYNSIPTDAYQALLSKAKAEQIAVIGHGVRAVGMQGILNAGQVMIAHAEEYLYTYFPQSLDESQIPEAVSITKSSGAFVTPNLCTYENIARQWGNPSALEKKLACSEMKYVSPKWKDNSWKQFDFVTRTGSIDNQYAFLKKFTKGLHDGGVPLLLGTDTPFVIGQANGFAIHDDIRNLRDCGLTPFQILRIGTKNASEFINKYVPGSSSFGEVKVGYRADLLLLQSSPVENLEALQDKVGVMINGRWISNKKLVDQMEALAKTF